MTFVRAALLLCLTVPAAAFAQAAPAAAEADSFRLHKFAQPIGWEHYTITHDGSSLELRTSFQFTDRGTPVALTATVRLQSDLTPISFAIKGTNARGARIDAGADVIGNTVRVRIDSAEHTVPTPGTAFAIDGYAPIVMQQELIRYWLAHGRPKSLRTLPSGNVSIVRRGADTLSLAGGRAVLQRYGVDGLIWGRETVWLDNTSRLAAVVTNDAEFDHFEATHAEYEPVLGQLISRAADDETRSLATLSRATAGDSGSFALVGGTVIDVTGAPPVADAVIVVTGGRISAVGPRASITIPRNVKRIDIAGKYVVPGLWDMHAHYEQPEWGPIYLAAGVTTARDVGNVLEFITAIRQSINSGQGIGPRLLLAGVIDGAGQYAIGVEQAATPEEGVGFVDRYHAAGFDQIKIYSSMSLPVLEAVTRHAHELGMTVTGHVPEGINALQGVGAGMDQINHIRYIAALMMGPGVGGAPPVFSVDSSWSKKALDTLRAHHTVVDPTLALYEWQLRPASEPLAQVEPGASHMPQVLRQPLESTGQPASAEARARVRFEQYKATLAALHRAGITIVAGTDQSIPGYSLHREIELYAENGFTPLEALQAATIVPATVMHHDRDSGTITAGKRADLLIVDADPLANVANLRKVALVVANGRRYHPAPLWASVGFTP